MSLPRIAVALVAGFGFGALLSIVPDLASRTQQEPTVNMALQAPSAKAWAFKQPQTAFGGALSHSAGLETRLRVSVMPDVPAVAADFGRSFHPSPLQKCYYVNEHASLCGNFVVLRPSTALRATTGKEAKSESSIDAESIINDLTAKVDSIEDKPQAALYAGGALLAVYFSNSILAAIDAIPLLPKLLELVGTGYSGWFIYRYLFFKSSRAELVTDIEELKKKVSESVK